MFQDETDTIVHKARSQISGMSSATLAPRLTPGQISATLPTPTLMRQPTHPISSEAIYVFASEYAGGVYLEYLPAIYSQQDRSRSLEKSLEAVSLSNMAKTQSRDDLRQLAQRSYGEALSYLKIALAESKTAATTGTIASILLLALFEAIQPGSPQPSREVWSTHVQGALAAIASCSASGTFQTPLGQSLLHHIVSVVQLDFLNRRAALPPQLGALYRASRLNEGPQAEMWAVLDRLAVLNSLPIRSSVTLQYCFEIQGIQNHVLSLLESMPQRYPESFAFTATAYDRGSDLDPKIRIPSHHFQSFRIAQAWNTLRLMCLLATKLLKSAVGSYLSFNTSPDGLASLLWESSRCSSIIANNIAIDICASVPDSLRPGDQSYDPKDNIRYSAWARSLLWPLSMARESPHGQEELQIYIEKQLSILATVAGMQDMQLGKGDCGDFGNNW